MLRVVGPCAVAVLVFATAASSSPSTTTTPVFSVADGSVETVRSRSPGTKPPGAPEWCSGSIGPAAWSPDGRWIAYESTWCARDGEWFVRSSIQILDSEGVWQHEIDNTVWGSSTALGPYNFVWSPDSRPLAFLDDASVEVYLGTAPATASGSVSQERLKAGLAQNAGRPSWQRSRR